MTGGKSNIEIGGNNKIVIPLEDIIHVIFCCCFKIYCLHQELKECSFGEELFTFSTKPGEIILLFSPAKVFEKIKSREKVF